MDLRSARHPDKSDTAVTREPGPVAGASVDLAIHLCPRFFQSRDRKDVSRRKRLQSLQDAQRSAFEKRHRGSRTHVPSGHYVVRGSPPRLNRRQSHHLLIAQCEQYARALRRLTASVRHFFVHFFVQTFMSSLGHGGGNAKDVPMSPYVPIAQR